MAISNRYKDLNDFLKGHLIKKGESSDERPITHTKIGSKALKIYGGCFHISDEDKPEFYRHYYQKIRLFFF